MHDGLTSGGLTSVSTILHWKVARIAANLCQSCYAAIGHHFGVLQCAQHVLHRHKLRAFQQQMQIPDVTGIDYCLCRFHPGQRCHILPALLWS